MGENYLCITRENTGGELLKLALSRSVRALRGYHNDFDMIVARGMSGVMVASLLSVKLQKHMAIIRKQGDSSHGNSIEAPRMLSPSRCLWVDDFICTGTTYAHVWAALGGRPPGLVLLYGRTRKKEKQVLWPDEERRWGLQRTETPWLFIPKRTAEGGATTPAVSWWRETAAKISLDTTLVKG